MRVCCSRDRWMKWAAVFFFFFVYSLLACDLCRSWRGVCTVRFLAAVRAVAARSKHPFCPPPKPVPRRCRAHQGNYKGNENVRLKEKLKGKQHRKPLSVPYSPPADATKEGVRNNGSSSAPSLSASALLSSSRSLLSRSSHSDASLPASSSTSSAGTVLPTSVDERQSRTA